MQFRTENFDDAYEHAMSVPEWTQIYSQITPGSLRSTLSQFRATDFQLFRENINQRLVQQGEAPRGRICFAVPLVVPGAARLQGREADGRSIFVLREGEEFMFHMPQGLDMLSITFDRDMFAREVESQPVFDKVKTLLRQPVIQVSEQRLVASRQRLIALFERSAALARSDECGQAAEQSLGRELLNELLTLMIDPACDLHQRARTSTSCFIVEKTHQITVKNASAPPSVIDLCDRLRVSRRTVQNSFRAVVETTPLHYIRSIRLNAVRRALMTTPASEMSIGDVAARWGFYHLSHFADEYHALFGELPSKTRRPAEAVDRTCALQSAA